MGEVYGNASSIHRFGQAAKQRLEGARRRVASMLGCDPREVVLTSGGTEADNLAIQGTMRRAGSGHIITSAIEHPAVLNTCAALERDGFHVSYIAVGRRGAVVPADIRAALRPDTRLISVMHANNETGVVQPIAEIAAIAHQSGAAFHSDAVQTAGRIKIDVHSLGVDLMSISGHKFGAPKGIGALYVKKGVELSPLLFGGRHERERRAGTENVAGAWALGVAADLEFDCNTLASLRDRLERGILARIPAVHVNGAASERIPNTTNLCFEGIEGEAMVISLDLKGFAVSSGSACSSGAVEPSHVLLAMGLSKEDARSSVRISLGPTNTVEEVDELIEAVVSSVAHLRRVSVAKIETVAHV
jgi:cysteine desulfurase